MSMNNRDQKEGFKQPKSTQTAANKLPNVGPSTNNKPRVHGVKCGQSRNERMTCGATSRSTNNNADFIQQKKKNADKQNSNKKSSTQKYT